ncbi:HD-GYP domain-containing protein [Tumebacillus permanentifrigoris]|uniref:HD domain-containing protein n=1 Tax=Tumebacillus permanentifrigoris TaxID=378543 RepID=A0A316DBH9_9BACL|nr:HD domain-containing phosphohydrolase [Tumebacillus permanentifrigoris]PWK14955.1 HD domain-containing protein [Tumebacillus permanentifrigoris]
MLSQVLDLYHTYMELILVTVGALFLLSFVLLLWQRRVRRRAAVQLDQTTRLLRHVKPSAGVENNLNIILEIYSGILDAYGYAFYVMDDAQQKYLLKAVRHLHDDKGKKAAPSYNRLAPDKKETYQPPISLPANAAGQSMELIKEGEVPLLTIPIKGGKGLIRIGPLSSISGKTRAQLTFVNDLLPQVVDMLVDTDRMKIQTDLVVTSEHALRSVSSMALNSEAVMKKALGMFATSMGIVDGFVMFQQTGGFQVPVLFGWTGEQEQKILRNREVGTQLWRALEHREVAVVRKGDSKYPMLAGLMNGYGDELLLIGKFIDGVRSGLMVTRVDAQMETGLTEDQLSTSIRSLSKQLTKLLRIQNSIKPMTNSYVELMKLLSRTIDDLNPYTVGYSELMSRYSIIIAQEMGLSQRDIQEVALAAYLSNIGVLGLSEDLYLKEGKFSEVEYEKMKLHVDVGAEIVEMLIGSKSVADNIRYHHERMDGHGYPAGLRGADIPVGARIIAVVQTFLAKINGRKYRTPLSFDKALELLKSSAGAQLDPQAVDALVRWFQRKRGAIRTTDRALGPCWEMTCSSAEVCATCPAYGQTHLNCWDVNKNNCQAHGKSCESCFVYTEAMGRRGTKAI